MEEGCGGDRGIKSTYTGVGVQYTNIPLYFVVSFEKLEVGSALAASNRRLNTFRRCMSDGVVVVVVVVWYTVMLQLILFLQFPRQIKQLKSSFKFKLVS